jgi:hypothetical protein
MTSQVQPSPQRSPGMSGLDNASLVAGDAGAGDRSLLRIGAVAAVLGIVLEVVMEVLHPSKADPNNSLAAFQEYAEHSTTWTAVHIGQFFAALCVMVALVALARSAGRQPGLPAALALLGGITAVMVATVFTVQMAVDGVALKAAFEAWANASGAAKESAFQTADVVRWLEKGLGGFFQMLNGVTLLALGLSLAVGRRYPRWLGWVGAVAGAGFVIGGFRTAHTGFSAAAGTILLAPTVLAAVFLIGIAVSMWRRSSRAG